MRGLIKSYQVYSTPYSSRHDWLKRAAASEVATLVREVDADVVAFFHTGSCLFGDADLVAIREANAQAVWICPRRRSVSTLDPSVSPKSHPVNGAAVTRRSWFAAAIWPNSVRRASGAFVTYTPSWANTEPIPPQLERPARTSVTTSSS